MGRMSRLNSTVAGRGERSSGRASSAGAESGSSATAAIQCRIMGSRSYYPSVPIAVAVPAATRRTDHGAFALDPERPGPRAPPGPRVSARPPDLGRRRLPAARGDEDLPPGPAGHGRESGGPGGPHDRRLRARAPVADGRPEGREVLRGRPFDGGLRRARDAAAGARAGRGDRAREQPGAARQRGGAEDPRGERAARREGGPRLPRGLDAREGGREGAAPRRDRDAARHHGRLERPRRRRRPAGDGLAAGCDADPRAHRLSRRGPRGAAGPDRAGRRERGDGEGDPRGEARLVRDLRPRPHDGAARPRGPRAGGARPMTVLLALLLQVSGDATIRAQAGKSELVIKTTSRLAGAIDSLRWDGKEFIDSTDHGRQLQSASNLDAGSRISDETFNPTEAGSRADHVGPKSSSVLLWLRAEGNLLETRTRMAFWLRPGETSGKNPAKNTTVVSDHLLSKRVTIGVGDLSQVVEYVATFTLPAGERHT